jgi:hypothetical protein
MVADYWILLLVTIHWPLATVCWILFTGHWSLVPGHRLLGIDGLTSATATDIRSNIK